MYPQFKKILESFNTDFNEKWVHSSTDKNKVEISTYAGEYDEYKSEVELGYEYNDTYDYETVLPDGNDLKISVYFSYCSLEDDSNENYSDLNDILYVGFNTYYGKKKHPPNKISWDDMQKLDPNEYELRNYWKGQPARASQEYHNRKLKEYKDEIENTTAAKGSSLYGSLKDIEKRHQQIVDNPFSHAKVANIIIGAVVNLTKKISKDYSHLAFYHETEESKKFSEGLVRKIAIKSGFYPEPIDKHLIKLSNNLGLEYMNLSDVTEWFVNKHGLQSTANDFYKDTFEGF